MKEGDEVADPVVNGWDEGIGPDVGFRGRQYERWGFARKLKGRKR